MRRNAAAVLLVCVFLSGAGAEESAPQGAAVTTNQAMEAAVETPRESEAAEAAVDVSGKIEIAEVAVSARISGQELGLDLSFEAVTKLARHRMLLIQGDVVLEKFEPAGACRLDYDKETKAYHVAGSRTGRHAIAASFVARPRVEASTPWREARVGLPSGRMRRVQVAADRPDLEVELPGAMRVERRVEGGQLTISALLGPNEEFVVRWKPQVKLADAKLVLSSQANTIVDVRAGLLHVDALFDFQITQGTIETLTFEVPAGVSITALDGLHIRTWTLSEAGGAARTLVVELSRPQERDYRLRIQGEMEIDALPAAVTVPAIEPTGGIRASGHLAVGTDSALQLVVVQSSGLTQIDAAGFPHVRLDGRQERAVATGKAFFYTYAGSKYHLQLTVDDIVPSYDVVGRVVATVKEDDLVVDCELELDVRDAPIRQLEIVAPAKMVVASVDGEQVEDYHLPESVKAGEPTTVRAVLAAPLLGRTLIRLRLELGHGPLGQQQTIPALLVKGAKTHRGYVVVAAEAGIDVEAPEAVNLREVHTASVPLRVAMAQFAYRYREPDWTLKLLARSKPAGIRAEVFHLQSIGEAQAYGSAVINYIITGSPVDELRFRLAKSLMNVDFVGRDVGQWREQDGVYVVKLTRKVIGDYNLAVTFTQPHGPGEPIRIGALHCEDVQAQSGYVVVTSHLDLKLRAEAPEGGTMGLLAINMDELPSDYRLLTSSPILAAYKYAADPHVAMLHIDPYRRSELLPVVVDIATHQTRLAVHPDGRVESVTTVRYKVKNTTGQFLPLTMPKEARVWAVSLIEQKDGAESRRRLAASYDGESGQLLVPLSRKMNPNDPSTVELEYGQVHKTGGWWRRRLDLEAPRCAVPITYADWRVAAPAAWAIAAAGGNMQAGMQSAAQAGLAEVLGQTARLWGRSMERGIESAAAWLLGVLAFVAVLMCVLFFRQRLPEVVLAVALAAVLFLGIGAGLCGWIEAPAPLTALTFTQAINADAERPLEVSASLVPAWRQGVSVADVAAAGLAIVLGSCAAVMLRRWWWLGAAMGLAAALYLAAEMPATWPVLKGLLTWGAPTVIAVWFAVLAVIRRVRGLSRPVQAALAPAVLIIAAISMAGGCAAAGGARKALAAQSMIERVECRLSAEADNVEAVYRLRIAATGAADFALLDASAVLTSSPRPAPGVTIRTEGGRHVVAVEKADVYDIEATFVAPLPAAGEDHQRRFEMLMPMALTNSVSLSIADANMLVDAPAAVRLARRVEGGRITVDAMFEPGAAAVFTWRPQERQASQEEVRFYAQDVALAHVSSGLLQVFHAVRLQIAQGQVDTLKLLVPARETVTSVAAADLGSWRFDPASRELELRLTRPATGTFEVSLVTQSASAAVPYEVQLKPLVIRDALSQHSILGVAADPSVYVRLDKHPPAMNARDYVRDAGELLAKAGGVSGEQITQAFRFDATESVVLGQVLAVQSELRSRETARFNAEDDRLVYNSQWDIEIAKAGRFDIALEIPEGYDIDTLVAEQVSHWDESVDAGGRHVRVHFKRKLVGTVQLKLTLSQPVSQMPERLVAPRVALADVLKHTGQLVVGSEQGVRLSVASRQGVSEVNPVELGEQGQGLLAFRLLRPDWQLQLQTELVQPRVTVQYLHVARVTDGLVRHEQYLRYRLFHAGVKTFDLALPAGATGVTITGPGIARREHLGQADWRVELADKVYERPYLLRVTYETQYDQAKGDVPLAAVRCKDADVQQGHTVVFATERVELSVDEVDAALRPAEARSIPAWFGAEDLSGAAMCYRSTSADAVLTVKARRHAAAEQIGADIRRTELATVVTPTGEAIHRVRLTLRVGSRRHLQTILPENGRIWSLSVDGEAAQPSIRSNAEGQEVLLVPLPQYTNDDAIVELVYVGPVPSAQGGWTGVHRLTGPRFDLPLKQITWHVYVPEGYSYGNFAGTLTVDKSVLAAPQLERYSMQSYEEQMIQVNTANEQFAQQQQTLARELAQLGRQADARRALSKGYNFSRNNIALNEDIRVDLDNLVMQQAKVGLVNARGRLRSQAFGGESEPQQWAAMQQAGMSFSQQQAERIESSLGKADSENLELITKQIIEAQEAAEGSVAQLQIAMPFSGKLLRFDSPLQVEPDGEMVVAFEAQRQRLGRFNADVGASLGLFAGLLVVGAAGSFVRRRWGALHALLALAAGPEAAVEPETGPEDEEPGDKVSAKELI